MNVAAVLRRGVACVWIKPCQFGLFCLVFDQTLIPCMRSHGISVPNLRGSLFITMYRPLDELLNSLFWRYNGCKPCDPSHWSHRYLFLFMVGCYIPSVVLYTTVRLCVLLPRTHLYDWYISCSVYCRLCGVVSEITLFMIIRWRLSINSNRYAFRVTRVCIES